MEKPQPIVGSTPAVRVSPKKGGGDWLKGLIVLIILGGAVGAFAVYSGMVPLSGSNLYTSIEGEGGTSPSVDSTTPDDTASQPASDSELKTIKVNLLDKDAFISGKTEILFPHLSHMESESDFQELVILAQDLRFDLLESLGIEDPEGDIVEVKDVTTSSEDSDIHIIIGGPMYNTISADIVVRGFSKVNWWASGGEFEVVQSFFDVGLNKKFIIIGGKDISATKNGAEKFVGSVKGGFKGESMVEAVTYTPLVETREEKSSPVSKEEVTQLVSKIDFSKIEDGAIVGLRISKSQSEKFTISKKGAVQVTEGELGNEDIILWVNRDCFYEAKSSSNAVDYFKQCKKTGKFTLEERADVGRICKMGYSAFGDSRERAFCKGLGSIF